MTFYNPGVGLGRQPWVGIVLVSGLLTLLVAHVIGVCLDFVAAIRYPFELDYGEGIVWQQAVLIPGPRMYSNSTDLPFIVFHYTPLYHLFTRTALLVQPDWLAAGRLVSSLATLPIALSAMGLVLIASRRPERPYGGCELAIALAVGLLVMCLHAVRSWGMLMRVDMVAIAFGTMGLLVGSWANGRFVGTVAALLLCVAAVYTKQSQLPAGISVFLVALLRNPRNALGAAVLSGAVGFGALEWMQVLTGGGFLHNIIGYNLNPFAIRHAFRVFWPERSSFPIMVVMLAIIPVLIGSLFPSIMRLQLRAAAREILALRTTDTASACRALLLLDFGFASLMLFTAFKSGGNYNYLLEWLVVGCVLIGVFLVDLTQHPRWNGWAFHGVMFVLVATLVVQPLRSAPQLLNGNNLAAQIALVRRIAAATRPVASENMTLLMRAGKQVIFEPAIVTDLAASGRWDESPLVRMIQADGFAFMITTDNEIGGGHYRSPAVDAAMRGAYPRVENAGHNIWLHLPQS